MKKWATFTNEMKFCEISFEGLGYRIHVTGEDGREEYANESISLQGAKKQIKRHLGQPDKIKWKEIETDVLETPTKLKLPTGYLSVSQVKKFLKCPKQYEYKYINKMKETKGSGLVLGSAFHRGMQMASIKKVVEGEILQTKDVLDIYSESFDYQVENHDIEWGEDDPDKVKDDGSQMMEKFYDEVGVLFTPKLNHEGMPMVEQKHVFDIVPGLPTMVYMDMVDEHGIVRDYKTSKKSPSKNIIDETIQLPVYSLAYRDLIGEKEKGISLDYAINLKKEKKIMQMTSGPVADERNDRVKETFVGVAKQINAGIFYPNEESNACGYCSFKDICKSAKK